MKINVRQAKHKVTKASESHLLRPTMLKGIPPGKAGDQKVNITFKIDENSLLTIKAESISNEDVKEELTT